MARRRAFGTVEKRPNRPGFCVRFRIQGRRIRRVAGTTKTAAKEKLHQVYMLVRRGYTLEEILQEVFGEITGPRLTFRDSVPFYIDYAKHRKKASTVVSDVSRFRVLCRGAWSALRLADIRSADLERWTAARLSAGIAGSTLNRDLSLASALFRWAMRLGYADANPVARVEKFSERGRGREIYLTPSEVKALLDAAGSCLRPLLSTAVFSGMRRGELLSLHWTSVDFEARQIVVEAETAKSGRTRRIPMARSLEEELQDLRHSRGVMGINGSNLVFLRPDRSPMTPDSLRRLWVRARGRCEAISPEKRKKITLHTLRHTCASLMQKAGVSLFEIGRILGHSSVQTTLRYAHLYADETRDAIDRLGEVVNLEPLDDLPAEGGL